MPPVQPQNFAPQPPPVVVRSGGFSSGIGQGTGLGLGCCCGAPILILFFFFYLASSAWNSVTTPQTVSNPAPVIIASPTPDLYTAFNLQQADTGKRMIAGASVLALSNVRAETEGASRVVTGTLTNTFPFPVRIGIDIAYLRNNKPVATDAQASPDVVSAGESRAFSSPMPDNANQWAVKSMWATEP